VALGCLEEASQAAGSATSSGHVGSARKDISLEKHEK
jgi:hypothetical protein